MSAHEGQKNTEFSDRMVSAYNKLMYVGSASVFVSVLDLETTNSFFGFNVKELNERWVELVFFLASFALAWNYFARVMDERRVLKEIDNKIIEMNIDLGSNLDAIKNRIRGYTQPIADYKASMDFVKEIANNKSLDKIAYEEAHNKFIDIKIKDLKDNINSDGSGGQMTAEEIFRLNNEKENTNKFPNILNLNGENLRKQIESSLDLLNSVLEANKAISKALEKIDLTISAKRKYFGWEKWRIISVDIFFPIILICSVLITFLYPNRVPELVLSLGNFLNFGDVKNASPTAL